MKFFVCNFLLIKSSLWSTNVFFFCVCIRKCSQMEASKLIEFDIQFSTVSFKIWHFHSLSSRNFLFCFYLRIKKHTWTIKGAWTLLGFWAVDKSGRTEFHRRWPVSPSRNLFSLWSASSIPEWAVTVLHLPYGCHGRTQLDILPPNTFGQTFRKLLGASLWRDRYYTSRWA